MAETIYFNGLNGKASKYGIRLSGKVDKIIEELQKHQNAKGYINLEISPRKEPDKYGNTHSVKVDKWEPTTKNNAPADTNYTEPAQNNSSAPADDDSLPF